MLSTIKGWLVTFFVCGVIVISTAAVAYVICDSAPIFKATPSLPVPVLTSTQAIPAVVQPTKSNDVFDVFKLNYDFYLNSTVMISGTLADDGCSNDDPSHQCNGSGVVIASDIAQNKTWILTNKHVIEADAYQNCSVWVYFYNERLGHVGTVTAVGTKTDADLAIVEIEGIYQPVPLADKDIMPFDSVFNVNVAKCVQNLITFGRVVQVNQEILGHTATTLAMSSDGGSSGSPVYDSEGKLVGVIFAGTQVKIPASHMIRISTIREFLADFNINVVK